MNNANDIGLLIVLSGPSGAGKGTVNAKVLASLPSAQKAISVTTRQPRNNERDGIDYYFKTVAEYKQLLAEDALLETAQVYGNYYGTLKSEVLNRVQKGDDVILEIDIQGARQIKDSYPECIRIFIVPPSLEELKARLIGRNTETAEAISRRLSETLSEIAESKKYDYIIINDDIERASNDVITIINAEKLKTTRNQNLINKFIGEIGKND